MLLQQWHVVSTVGNIKCSSKIALHIKLHINDSDNDEVLNTDDNNDVNQNLTCGNTPTSDDAVGEVVSSCGQANRSNLSIGSEGSKVEGANIIGVGSSTGIVVWMLFVLMREEWGANNNDDVGSLYDIIYLLM